jgi:quinol monooxygenase YgiN
LAPRLTEGRKKIAPIALDRAYPQGAGRWAIDYRGRVETHSTTTKGGALIVVRFKMQSQPDKAEQVLAALQDVIAPSRALAGVVSFDIARDLADPNAFIATEVFDDRAALDRQESLPEVGRALAVLEESLVAEPEATIFHVSSSEPWG